ncbi:MAG: hypothetical protein R3C61_27690 [Bacteroidia bacterium]
METRKVTDYPYKPRDVNFDPNTFSLFSGNDKTLWIRTVEGIQVESRQRSLRF